MKEILDLGTRIYVTSKDRVLSSTSSKGNQIKWYCNGKWIKADDLGYEGFAESVASRLLHKSNISDYVEYKCVQISETDTDKEYTGCISENFLESGESLITLYRLFTSYGINLDLAMQPLSTEERIEYVVKKVEEFTGLSKFREWLGLLLEFDAVILNEDRHLHNIGVVKGENGYRLMPVFDNGAGLLSDTTRDYRLGASVSNYINKVRAKPFNTKFSKQVKAAQSVCSSLLTLEDVNYYTSNYYSEEIVERVNRLIEITVNIHRR